ncbi:hypothetical protein HII36_08390 [Nonomuraea sp. NN258]|uniref:hypothetical protein n=1 Tax=Nonomuraea antri TaxID=2730852 RepID=UPI001569BBF2|nr:hypothetical protein [Nonomuraea antri]NRQ31857.1 hypothetical protein [Nonomuraea antri]
MSGWLPGLGEALAHGPLVAFAAAFAISPGIPAVLALVLERRLLRPRAEFVAFIYGDPLLALATALGVGLCGSRPPDTVAPLLNGWPAWLIILVWLGFGLGQWYAEVRAGKYTRAQALAPTKIWHQIVIYPVLGYVVTAAVTAGMASPQGVGAKALMTGCALAWVVANVYDRVHLKLGHPPYEWRRLRPYPAPWEPDSESLRQSGLADSACRAKNGKSQSIDASDPTP